jgi:hypothetical protein
VLIISTGHAGRHLIRVGKRRRKAERMTGASPVMVDMDPVTFEEAVNTSEPLHSPVGGVPPPAEVVLGFCCRIGAAAKIVDADDSIPGVKIRSSEGLLRRLR